MKTFLTRITFVITLLAIGFAAGFPVGNTVGFTGGSEWALVQADILAREAGLFRPVVFEDGIFRVITKPPRGLNRRVWQLADRYEETMQRISEKSTKTDEIVYALHDQTTEAERSSQELQQQTTDKIVSASQDPAAQAEQSLQEGRQQTADETIYGSQDSAAQTEWSSQEGRHQGENGEVGASERNMSDVVTSAATSTTI
jgi:hypothetical protein